MVRLYFGDDLGRYHFGNQHPFGPNRIHAFWKETNKRSLHQRVEVALPVSCTEDDLLRFHTAVYVNQVKDQSEHGSGYLDLGDTPAVQGIYEAACYVVGSDLDALQSLVSGQTARVMVPIAGLHHAHRDRASGFCVFNDAGIIIESLRQLFGIRRIAYIDIDAHHGDGVYYAYEQDPDVIVADIHEDGRFIFPGTGASSETGKGEAEGSKLNIPLDPGSDDAVFHTAWAKVEEFVRAAAPEVIILQAGADSIRNDPITHLEFTPQAHYHATRQLCRLADEFCNGRIIALGGGGYNLENIAQGWNNVVQAMVES